MSLGGEPNIILGLLLAFGRLPPGEKLCLADILRINSTQHYNLDLTLSEAAYQMPGYEASTLVNLMKCGDNWFVVRCWVLLF